MDIQTTNQTAATSPESTVVRPGWIRRVRRHIFHRRVAMAFIFAFAWVLFLMWLSPDARVKLAIGLFTSRVLVSLLLLFSVITLSLLWAAGQNMDAWVFLYFNVHGSRPRWLDAVMWTLTQGGNMGVAIAIAAIAYFTGHERLAIDIVLGLLSLWFIVETIKAFTDRARPFAVLKDVRVIGWRALGRSFPSGHTAQAFFLASIIVHQLGIGSITAVLVYVLAGLVGVTRMYVGAHYPRDVIAGALTGLVWALVIILVGAYL